MARHQTWPSQRFEVNTAPAGVRSSGSILGVIAVVHRAIFAVMPAHNILVVVVDGLRASALGSYGNTSFPTPALDRFAADSFLLDWCYAPSPDLAGIYRALWRSAPPSPDLNADSLTRVLTEKGYATTLITDDPQLEKLQSARAFDQYLQLAGPQTAAASPARAADVSQTSLAHLFATALGAISSTASASPQFVWVHARGLYGPWDAPLDLQHSLLDEGDPPPVESVTPPDFIVADTDDPDLAFRYACAYAAQAMVLDECWEGFIKGIETARAADHWLVMLLGARGFPLGEHRRIGGIDPRLFGEQLHVPWLIRFPDGLGQLARSSQLVSHFDVVPTLLESIGIRAQEGAPSSDGIGVLKLATAALKPPWRDALVSTSNEGHRAIRTADWFLRSNSATPADESASIAPPHDELYVRPDDRWEANDVAKLCPDVVETLSATMSESLQPVSQSEPA
jgi:arylsulfatase A-like enzyme